MCNRHVRTCRQNELKPAFKKRHFFKCFYWNKRALFFAAHWKSNRLNWNEWGFWKWTCMQIRLTPFIWRIALWHQPPANLQKKTHISRLDANKRRLPETNIQPRRRYSALRSLFSINMLSIRESSTDFLLYWKKNPIENTYRWVLSMTIQPSVALNTISNTHLSLYWFQWQWRIIFIGSNYTNGYGSKPNFQLCDFNVTVH